MEYLYRPESLYEALPPRRDDSFKGTYGKVLVIAGSRNMCGAAYFAAKAAYRIGAGLVCIYTPECNRIILQQRLPEAVLVTYEPETWEAQTLQAALEGKDALAAGPGLGTDGPQKEILKTALAAEIPCVLDADALNILAQDDAVLAGRRGPLILTPHLGEMSRLCRRRIAEIKADPAGTALRFSREHHVITVLKDARTVVSDGEDCFFNTTGNHGMATGGSGDVLTGIIGGLLAQKAEPLEAAKLGVYLHGLAGDRARDEIGAYSMMAGDILEHIRF